MKVLIACEESQRVCIDVLNRIRNAEVRFIENEIH